MLAGESREWVSGETRRLARIAAHLAAAVPLKVGVQQRRTYCDAYLVFTRCMVTGLSYKCCTFGSFTLICIHYMFDSPAALLRTVKMWATRTVATLDDCANWATTDSVGMQFEFRRCETEALLNEFHVSRAGLATAVHQRTVGKKKRAFLSMIASSWK